MNRFSALDSRAAWWRRLIAAACGTPSPGDPRLRIARAPRTLDEERVAAILGRLPSPTRCALLTALADDLRQAEHDPFRGAGGSELGFWRLSLYQTAADELVTALLGDFLAEDPSPA